MTRIVAGSAGGRRLVVPPSGRTRPTAERTREALFSTVITLVGSLDGRHVLDLYAGSGALGLEALSRGAERAVLVEHDPAALRALRANVAALRLAGAVVVPDRVERHLAGPAPVPAYDLVFADPPYTVDVGPALAALSQLGWLTSGAVVVVERSRRDPPLRWPAGLAPVRERVYGEARLWYGRGPDQPDPAGPAGRIGADEDEEPQDL